MASTGGKLLAIVFGGSLGGLAMALAWWQRPAPEEPLLLCPGTRAVFEAPPASCDIREGLRITDEDGNEWFRPLTWEDSGRSGRVIAANFLTEDGYGEERMLALLKVDETEVWRVVPAYGADFGEFQCAVLKAHLHRHTDALCFDLIAVIAHGSNAPERWRGRLPMPPW